MHMSFELRFSRTKGRRAQGEAQGSVYKWIGSARGPSALDGIGISTILRRRRVQKRGTREKKNVILLTHSYPRAERRVVICDV